MDTDTEFGNGDTSESAYEPVRRRRSAQTTQTVTAADSRRKDVIRRIVWISLIIGALVGIFFTGKAANTGMDSTSGALPEHVDRLIPESGAQVLRQSQIGIDVAAGHDAYLIVNGVEVRTAKDGLIRDLGTGLVLLQPGPDKAIEILNEGRNCVVAMVWDKLENKSSASPVSWCFDAT